MVKIEITDRLAYELKTWAMDERDMNPSGTAYQADLARLIKQIPNTECPKDSYGDFNKVGEK